MNGENRLWEDVIRIKIFDSVRAHQRPINMLQSEGGRVVTACQDHTLKVLKLQPKFLNHIDTQFICL